MFCKQIYPYHAFLLGAYCRSFVERKHETSTAEKPFFGCPRNARSKKLETQQYNLGLMRIKTWPIRL